MEESRGSLEYLEYLAAAAMDVTSNRICWACCSSEVDLQDILHFRIRLLEQYRVIVPRSMYLQP